MISAEQFAHQNSVWHIATPSLEQFLRWMNHNLRHIGPPIAAMSDPLRNSFIAEAAFTAAATTGTITEAESVARGRVTKLPRGRSARSSLTPLENSEAGMIRDRLLQYTMSATVAPVYRPSFAGSGVVDDAVGDIYLPSAEELVEVKAVQRWFRGSDLRQVLTYASLAGEGTPVTSVTLLNPRLGIFYKSSCEDLAQDIGAGSWVELRLGLLDFMSGLALSD